MKNLFQLLLAIFYWEKLRVHPEVWCEFLCREMLMAQEYMRNEEAFKMVRAGDCITICRQEDTHGSVINQWGCISCQSMLYMLNWLLSWIVGQCVHVDTRILCHRFFYLELKLETYRYQDWETYCVRFINFHRIYFKHKFFLKDIQGRQLDDHTLRMKSIVEFLFFQVLVEIQL